MKQGFDKVTELHAMIEGGQARKAIDQLRALIQREPQVATWHGLMARASGVVGLDAQAEIHARIMARMRPEHPTSWTELGEALQRQGKMQEARESFDKAVQINPKSALACLGLAGVLTDLGRWGEAQALLHAAIEQIPGNEPLLGRYSMILGKLARMSDAVSQAEQALQKFPRSWELAQCAAVAGNYCIDDPARLFEMHRRFGELFEYRGVLKGPQIENVDPERLLRVGLVSPDFRGHSVSYFVEPLLRHADRTRVEYVLFSTGPRDHVTDMLRSCGHVFHDMFGKPRTLLKERLLGAKLDILIDLCGHMRGGDLELLRARLAPLQINYCGYPNTLGLKSVDFRLVDEVTDPSGWSDACATETLIRVQGCFLSFAPRQGSLECDVERVENLPPTFGSFNAARKISDQYLALCRAVLERVPESRLVFKSMDFRAPECEAIVRDRAGTAGIDQARLTLLGPSDDTRNHLEAYRGMHVALDTYPYSGTTTTCEALLMGVPVVTLMGRTHPSRVSASLLRAAGIDGCVAETAEEFADCAARQMELELANPHSRRERQRKFLSSELCDGKEWAGHFEAALRSAWQMRLGAKA